MGLTERHWFENEDVPENYEWALEDAVYNSRTNKKYDDDIARCKDCKHRINEMYDYYGNPNNLAKNQTSSELTGSIGKTMADREKVIETLERILDANIYDHCLFEGERQFICDVLATLRENDAKDLWGEIFYQFFEPIP